MPEEEPFALWRLAIVLPQHQLVAVDGFVAVAEAQNAFNLLRAAALQAGQVARIVTHEPARQLAPGCIHDRHGIAALECAGQ